MIVKAVATAAAFAVLTCCQKQAEPDKALNAIGFGSVCAAEPDAANTKSGVSNFGRDFIVCGIKDLEGDQYFVFPGYEVRYNNPDYSYEFGAQTIRYWDPAASA